MKTVAALAVLCAFAAAQGVDDVRRAIAAGEYERAEALADTALEAKPGDALLIRERARAVRGRARMAQRAEGYAAAIDILEPYADDAALVPAYADACLWGGQEDRGIKTLRASAADKKARTWYEFQLLSHLRRYDEIRERARAEGDDDWLAWANRKAALHARFEERTARARWIALGGVVIMLVAAAALLRFAPRAAASAPASS